MYLPNTQTTFGADDQSWLGSEEGTDNGVPITVTARTADVTAGVIPSGTLVDSKTGELGPDGSTGHDCTGFILGDIPVRHGAVPYTGTYIWQGRIKDANRVAKGLTALTAQQITSLRANGNFVIN